MHKILLFFLDKVEQINIYTGDLCSRLSDCPLVQKNTNPNKPIVEILCVI